MANYQSYVKIRAKLLEVRKVSLTIIPTITLPKKREITVQGRINRMLLRSAYITHGYMSGGELETAFRSLPNLNDFGANPIIWSFRLAMGTERQEGYWFEWLNEAVVYADQASRWAGRNDAPYAYFAYAVCSREDFSTINSSTNSRPV